MEKIIEVEIIFDECPVKLQNEKYEKTRKNSRVENVNLENENIIDQEHVDIGMSSIDMMGLIVL